MNSEIPESGWTPFEQAFAYVLGNEGVRYTNNPKDSGGPTKYGVTLKSYTTYLGRAVSPIEIEMLSADHAKKFYFDRYWCPVGSDRIANVSIAVALFDTAVLYGVGTSALHAQMACVHCDFLLKLDGVVGDTSVEALNHVDRSKFLSAFHELILHRIDMVIKLNPKNEAFRAGWTTRADRLLTLDRDQPFSGEVD